MLTPAPGSLLAVDFGLYRHVGLVSDRMIAGRPMVISNSYRRGGVHEEPWEEFACGRPVMVIRSADGTDAAALLARARTRIGSRWKLLTWNCEHFVTWACGDSPGSPQIRSAARGVALVCGTILLGGLAGYRRRRGI